MPPLEAGTLVPVGSPEPDPVVPVGPAAPPPAAVVPLAPRPLEARGSGPAPLEPEVGRASPEVRRRLERALAGDDDDVRELIGPAELRLATAAQKARLIEHLLDGFTGDDDEAKILEILGACRGRAFDAVLSELHGRGRLQQLFDDVHGAEYRQLLALVSERTTDPAMVGATVRCLCDSRVRDVERSAILALLRGAESRGELTAVARAVTRGGANQVLCRLDDAPEILRLLSPSPAAPSIPGGRIAGPLDLGQLGEERILKASGGRGVLMPYGRFDPSAEPVVVVHGITGSPEDLRRIIERYEDQPGKQVYVYFYDDTGRYLDRDGHDLARRLEELRTGFLPTPTPRLTIVAHSMGGIVSRAALSSLIDPPWNRELYRAEAGMDRAHIADYQGGVDLVTIDTPWHGYGTAYMNARRYLPGELSIWDMVSDSGLLAALHKTPLPDNVRLHQLEASESAAGLKGTGVTTTLAERGDKELAAVIRWLGGDTGALRGQHQLANLVNTLAETDAFRRREAELRAAAANGTLTTAQLRQALSELAPAFAGDHMTVLENPALLQRIDAVVR